MAVAESIAKARMGRTRAAWADVRSALSGEERDFTTEPIGRSVFVLSIPMVLEMLMESLFTVVDALFVARLGPAAVAALGLTESVIVLVIALGIGVGMAVTATVARRIGEGDPDAAAYAAASGLTLGVLGAVLVGVPGAIFGADILRLMGADADVVAIGSGYTRVMLGGSGTLMLLFIGNSIFRGAGNPTIAMRVLWLANGINIVLDACLVFGLGPFPRLGVTGAAVATTTGRALGVLYLLWALTRGRGRVRVEPRHLRFDPVALLRLLRAAAGGVMQFLVATASWLGLVRIIAVFGSSALAGYTVAVRVMMFTILPAWGMSNAAATLVGQNLGAGHPERANTAVFRTGAYVSVFMSLVAVVFLAWPGRLMAFFTSDPDVTRYGIACLRWIAIGYPIYGWGMVMIQAFNGAGDTWTPTWINLALYWGFQIPLAWALARAADLGPKGAFIAVPAAECAVTLVSIAVWRRGRWKQKRV